MILSVVVQMNKGQIIIPSAERNTTVHGKHTMDDAVNTLQYGIALRTINCRQVIKVGGQILHAVEPLLTGQDQRGETKTQRS